MVMEKFVSQANKQLNQKLEPQEVDSLVQTPRRNDAAPGHRLCIYLRKFEELEREVRFTKICESAGFIRRVSVRMHYITVHHVNDGFEGSTGDCREYTLTRDDPESEVKHWIYGQATFGPVLQVKTTCCLDFWGNEIEIPPHQETVQNPEPLFCKNLPHS